MRNLGKHKTEFHYGDVIESAMGISRAMVLSWNGKDGRSALQLVRLIGHLDENPSLAGDIYFSDINAWFEVVE